MANEMSLLLPLLVLVGLMQVRVLVVGVLVVGQPEVPCYFIFGDSLVDSGNNNGLVTMAKANYLPYGIQFPTGVTGRFTNGRTVVDNIGILLGFFKFIPPFATATDQQISTGVNYGSGSAGIREESGSQLGDRISLDKQLQNHATIVSRLIGLQKNVTFTREYLKKCIYISNIGSSDYINNYFMPKNYPTSRIYTPTQYAQVLVQQYSQQLKTLYKLQGRKIAVFSLGQIGCTPGEVARFNTSGKPCVDFINDAVNLFNDRLKPLVDELNTDFSDARFTLINTTSITAPPLGVRLASTVPCCQVRGDGQCVPNSIPCLDRDLRVYYDDYHPTEIVNDFIAARSYVKLSPMDAYPYDISQLAHL